MLQTAAYYLAFVVVGLTTASFGPSLPGFVRNTGSTLSQVGALFVFHRIGYMSGSLGGGRLIDRLQGNKVTGAVLFVIAAGLVSVAYAGMLPLLLGGIFVLGLAQGTAEVGANTGIVRLHGEKAGPFMNGLHLSFGIGAMTSPLILTASIRGTGSIRAGFLFLAFLAAAAGIWVFRLAGSDRSSGKSGKEVFQKSRSTVFFIGAVLFFTIAGESGFAGWVYSYALKTGLSGEAGAGLLTSAFWTSLTIGRLAGIDLIRRLGARGLLILNLSGAASASVLFLLLPGSIAVLWICVILLGFSQASIIPASFTLAGERKILSGAVAGAFIAASSAGGMSLPWLIGRFFDSVGPIAFPALIAVSQVAAFLAVFGVLFAARRIPGNK